MRVVLDTNVLIDGAQDTFSAQAKLIDAVIGHELVALASTATEREYRTILRRFTLDAAYQERLTQFLASLEQVSPAWVDTQIDDVEDRKFLQVAVGGQADYVITSDRHLLQLGEIEETNIITPQEGWVKFEVASGTSNEWEQWATGLGIR